MASHSPARPALPAHSRCPRHDGIDSLLVRVGDGDHEAFAALYDGLHETVYAMSLRRGQEARHSAQVTYDVFLQAWRQARAYDPAAGSAWAWLHAIAVNVIDSRVSDPADGSQPPHPERRLSSVAGLDLGQHA